MQPKVPSSDTFWLLFFAIAMVVCLFMPRDESDNETRTTAALADINGGIQYAVGQYKADIGYFPKSLQNLVQKPDNASNWRGPYLDPPRLPVDPWGHEYIYVCPGAHNTNSYDLVSAGPDGKVGTEDDIENWTK